jgi:hypothetical protein
MSKQALVHSPTLRTIRMVESALKNSENSVITIPELKRSLPKQVNHNVLKAILEYLEECRKIFVSIKGITWIYNPSRKMKEAIRKSFKYPEDFAE